MNFILDVYQFHPKWIYFMDKRKNNVINGIFTKIIFSNEYFSMTGIYFPFSIYYIQPNGEYELQNQSYSAHTNSVKNQHHLTQYSPTHQQQTWVSIYNKDHFIQQYILKLCQIEEQLLEMYKTTFSLKKTPIYSLKTQLSYGTIKIYKEDEQYITESLINIIGSSTSRYILKISGIWENTNQYGITFKIIRI